MVVVKLQGGLGNQLFQWALAKSLSIKFNVETYIDIIGYDNQVNITKRGFSLNKLPNISYNLFNNTNNGFTTIYDDFIFKEFNIEKDNNYFFDGYWQSEKYFIKYSNIIKNELSPNQNIKKDLHKIIPEKNNSVSLHVRRTDYVTSNGYHPLQDINYYNSAIEHIGEYDNLYIFSDDIVWCKENLHYKNMTFVEGNDSITDIWLQSICKNNIIANSSFSWWGSWLNNNVDKKVISPLKWFGDHVALNTSDIIPKNYIKI
jgi:hypothetical protein